MKSYVSDTKQIVKVYDPYKYSSWSKILFGVPEGFLLGPLLFDIFICNLFFCFEDSDILLKWLKKKKNQNLTQRIIIYSWAQIKILLWME